MKNKVICIDFFILLLCRIFHLSIIVWGGVGDSLTIPIGPLGRVPVAGIRLVSGLNNTTILTQFEDGSVGIWKEKNQRRTYDGSKYEMITHSHSEIGKIEKNHTYSKLSSTFLVISVIFALGYLALTLYLRSNSVWPIWIDKSTGWSRDYILIAIPTLIWLSQNRFFKINAGEITLFPINSDPYVFPVESPNIRIVSDLCYTMFILILMSLFYEEGANVIMDSLLFLLILLVVTRTSIRRNIIENIIGNTKSQTPILGIEGFVEQIERTTREIDRETRLGNPLLELLMSNESPTLEFKGSLWASYHGVTGRPVQEQQDKNFSLQDSVLKTVAAFLNTSGGTLLIGIKDKPRDSGDQIAEVLGIEPDYRWLKKGKQNTEGYGHVLTEIFRTSLSNPSSSQYIEISFPVFEGRTICRIDVEPLPRRVGQQCFATTKTMDGKKLFVRSGDSSIPQSRETEYHYIRHHFEGFSGNNNQS